MLWRLTLLLALMLFASAMAAAHGGGLNAQGCHNDRRNGDYHCHRGPSAPDPAPPPRSTGQTAYGTGGTAAYYPNCAAARAAGAAPLRRGDAGYRAGLDRDGDGVACE